MTYNVDVWSGSTNHGCRYVVSCSSVSAAAVVNGAPCSGVSAAAVVNGAVGDALDDALELPGWTGRKAKSDD